MLARYHCKARGLYQLPDGHWVMGIKVLDEHVNAPAGTEGRTSALRSIDFEHGVAVTRNSVYVFDPNDLKEEPDLRDWEQKS